MTTTMMRDSIVGDAWIQQTMQANPIRPVLDEKGAHNGNYTTGPVRLSWLRIDELPEPKPGDDKQAGYEVTALFPPGTDFQPLYDAYYAGCAKTFADHLDAASGQYYGLHSPFRAQAEKLKYQGYTPGGTFIKFSTNYKPPVVDSRFNPVVDKNKIYPGVWAICVVNAYPYGMVPRKDGKPTKKGIAFGLQSIMLIGDDTKFGNGAPDPKKQFAGVNVQAPIVRPNMANMPAGAAPAAAPTPLVPQQQYVPNVGYAPVGAQPAGYMPQPPAQAAVDPDEDPSMYQ